MTTLQTAAQQALEALEWCEPAGTVGRGGIEARKQAIAALRAALAQQAEPAQEPVAEVFVRRDGVSFAFWLKAPPPERTKLYTAPPQRKPLTQEDVDRICASLGFAAISPAEIVRAVERAHGIGETK